MTIYLNSARKIQFELSSMCNLLCLGCVRTDTGNFSEKKEFILNKNYLSKETFLKIISAKEFESVTHLEFCGTIDDPLMHPEFLEFLELALTVRQFKINIHTNASLRNVEYWQQLATVLKKHKHHQVNFSIDGLEDTNHIYRQGSTWSKIMENAEAFIAQGGNAIWQFLIFPWNKHQIETAKQLSETMKFSEFHQRIDRSVATQLGLEKINIIKRLPESKNRSALSLEQINDSLKDKVNDAIECNNQTNGMYFVSNEGRLWPCCFMQNGLLSSEQGRADLLKSRIIDAYDEDWNNCNLHSINDIINHRFYTEDLIDSWDSNVHGNKKKDRIHRCTEVCSRKNIQSLPIGKHNIKLNIKNE